MATTTKRLRSARIVVRVPPEDKALIDRAVEASGIDRTKFVVASLRAAARRAIADRTESQDPGIESIVARREDHADEHAVFLSMNKPAR